MSNWATRKLEGPHAFIQWKGTNVCADYYCACGKHFHVDDYFAYAVQCPHCERRYEVSAMIEMRYMPPEEQWDGCEIIEGLE